MGLKEFISKRPRTLLQHAFESSHLSTDHFVCYVFSKEGRVFLCRWLCLSVHQQRKVLFVDTASLKQCQRMPRHPLFGGKVFGALNNLDSVRMLDVQRFCL